jgi:hypothetical protein
MKRIILSILLFLSVFIFRPISAQVDTLDSRYAVNDTQDVKVTLFDTDAIFEISLKFDINKYKRLRSDSIYLPAVLTYHISETDSVVKDIKLRARGNIRRTAICDFPPLMLNFKLKDSEGTEFSGINKLKIVPYCKLGYEQYVLKEYLVYKLYNVLTDLSMRVRLFKITYINSVKQKKPITQYGFAIEPVEHLEDRTNTKEIEYSGLTQRHIRQDMLDRAAIFNYMIGNTDWAVPIKHNVIILRNSQFTPVNENLIVPYDFDYSGLVATDYAVPFDALPIKRVQERLYMAVCRSETEFSDALNEFAEKKDEFYKVINSFPHISEKSRKVMINYLDSFFDGMDRRSSLVKRLLNDCIWFEQQSNLRVR